MTYLTFMDLKKNFGQSGQRGLMEFFGNIMNKEIGIGWQKEFFCEQTSSCVRIAGNVSSCSRVRRELRLGCGMSRWLLSIYKAEVSFGFEARYPSAKDARSWISVAYYYSLQRYIWWHADQCKRARVSVYEVVNRTGCKAIWSNSAKLVFS